MATMTKARAADQAEAADRLRKLLRPGDTVYTVLRHVSSSGMSRRIDLFVIRRGELAFLSGYVGKVLGYRRHPRKDGLVVGGCGMDMGFHLVHELGYALWGKLAAEGNTPRANRLRERLAVACRSYLCQGGGSLPDAKTAGGPWVGATGYALRHQWI